MAKLGLVLRNRKKISQIIKDYFYSPFFLLIIIWYTATVVSRKNFSLGQGMEITKGIGPSMTLTWPGWRQNEIRVKVDWHDSKEAVSRKVVYYCTTLLPKSRVATSNRLRFPIAFGYLIKEPVDGLQLSE